MRHIALALALVGLSGCSATTETPGTPPAMTTGDILPLSASVDGVQPFVSHFATRRSSAAINVGDHLHALGWPVVEDQRRLYAAQERQALTAGVLHVAAAPPGDAAPSAATQAASPPAPSTTELPLAAAAVPASATAASDAWGRYCAGGEGLTEDDLTLIARAGWEIPPELRETCRPPK